MIKRVEEKDIDSIVLLEKELLGQTIGKSYLEHLITIDEAGIFKYEEDGILKGYIGFTINGEYMEMLNVVVSKEHQREGVGTKLLKHVIEFQETHKIKSIILEVNVNNIIAQKLYSNNNFQKMLIRKNYYQIDDKFEDAVVMIKE